MSAGARVGPPTAPPTRVHLPIGAFILPAVNEIKRQRQVDPGYYNVNGLGPNLPAGIEVLADAGIVRTS